VSITVYVLFGNDFLFFWFLPCRLQQEKKKQLLVLVILPHCNELMCFVCFLSSLFSFAVLHKGSVLVHNRFHES